MDYAGWITADDTLRAVESRTARAQLARGGFYEGRHLCPDMRAAPVAQVVPAKAPMARGTYKYRDPVKRRAQVAAAVRKWRARKAARGTAASLSR
jgi:hypothetical protein